MVDSTLPDGYVVDAAPATGSAPLATLPAGYALDAVPSSANAIPASIAAPAMPDVPTLSRLFWQAVGSGDQDTQHKALQLIHAQGGQLASADPNTLGAATAQYNQRQLAQDAPDSLANVAQLGISAGHHLLNLPLGLAQLASHTVPGVPSSATQALDRYVAQREQDYQAAIPTSSGAVLGATLGEVAPWAVGLGEARAAGLLPKATGYLGRIGTGAAEGAAMGATQTVTNPQDDAYWLDKLKQMGTGALVGGAIPGTLGAPSALLQSMASKVAPDALSLAQTATNKYGIPITATQLSTSVPLKYMQSAAEKLPFSGTDAFKKAQQSAFNDAVASQIHVEPYAGVTKPVAPTGALTSDVFAQARQNASNVFQHIFGNNDAWVTPADISKINTILGDASATQSNSVNKLLAARVNQLMQQSVGSTIPGRAFQSVDSQLGQDIASGNGAVRRYAGELQQTLRDMMGNSLSAEDANALADARQKWANMEAIKPLVSKAQGADGNISPALLMNAVSSNNLGKTAMATGNAGNLGELAQIGQRFLKDITPESGTAPRMQYYEGLKRIGALAVPGAATPLVGAIPALAGTGATLAIGRGISSALRSPGFYNALAQAAQFGAQPAGVGFNALGLLTSRLATLPSQPTLQPTPPVALPASSE